MKGGIRRFSISKEGAVDNFTLLFRGGSMRGHHTSIFIGEGRGCCPQPPLPTPIIKLLKGDIKSSKIASISSNVDSISHLMSSKSAEEGG